MLCEIVRNQALVFLSQTQGLPPEAKSRIFFLTILIVVLCVPLLFVIRSWMKSTKKQNTYKELERELLSFEAMKRKGLLTEEEHKKIVQQMRQRMVQSLDKGPQEGKQVLSEQDLLRTLAKETAGKDPSKNRE